MAFLSPRLPVLLADAALAARPGGAHHPAVAAVLVVLTEVGADAVTYLLVPVAAAAARALIAMRPLRAHHPAAAAVVLVVGEIHADRPARGRRRRTHAHPAVAHVPASACDPA